VVSNSLRLFRFGRKGHAGSPEPGSPQASRRPAATSAH